MLVVKGTSLIPSHRYSVQRFLQSFLFYPYSISTPPSSLSFQSYFLFFNSFILHFYTSTAVDTCSFRLPIFNSSTGLTQLNCRIQGQMKASNSWQSPYRLLHMLSLIKWTPKWTTPKSMCLRRARWPVVYCFHAVCQAPFSFRLCGYIFSLRGWRSKF